METGLWDQVIQGGIATAALMVLILWLGYKGGVWVFARELIAQEKAAALALANEKAEREKDRIAHEAQIVREREQCLQDKQELRRDRDEWKLLALEGTAIAERAIHRKDGG